MSDAKRAKEIMLQVLASYERLYVENYLLKQLLETSLIPQVQQTWRKAFQELSEQPETKAWLAGIGSDFGTIRDQVSAAVDEDAALQFLAQLPTKGKPI